jgi:hypothetical protein
MNKNTVIILVILLIALVHTVQADADNPPGSITFCGYVSHCNEIGVWWLNATDADFNGVQIWFDDVYQTTSPADSHFHNQNTPIIGDHIISTHTIDMFGNVNATWVNVTVSIGACPVCKEGWFCGDEYCAMPNPIPTVTVTPTSWANQTFNPVTDICTISADMGETWIKWDATCNTTVEVLYYIDGVKLEDTPPYGKLDPNRLILSDLHSMETHNLKIYYLGNIVAESTIETLPSWYMLLFFIVLSITLSVIGILFVSSPILRILLGGLAFSIAVWMLTMVTGWMLVLPVLPALVAGICIILALYDQVHTSWGN